MSKIEVGEYIRTNRGIIAKVIYIREATRYRCTSGTISHSPERYFLDNEQKHSVSSGYVKAHSKNILDIVEVGDYINGDIVNQITKNYISVGYITIGKRNIKNIRTVLTHEQYEQNCYKVVE